MVTVRGSLLVLFCLKCLVIVEEEILSKRTVESGAQRRLPRLKNRPATEGEAMLGVAKGQRAECTLDINVRHC